MWVTLLYVSNITVYNAVAKPKTSVAALWSTWLMTANTTGDSRSETEENGKQK